MRILVVTGTPGTGKTTIAENAAMMLKGARIVHINDLVKEKRLYTSRSKKDGALVVDMRRLKQELGRVVREQGCRILILEGHVLCDLRVRGAIAVVVREHLSVLLKRMRRRGYGPEKIMDNLVCEATDYCGIKALANYSRVYELMGRNGAPRTVADIAEGKRVKLAGIELLHELEPLLEVNRSVLP
jgi:adenylate kinase